jgi:hypothetical protein
MVGAFEEGGAPVALDVWARGFGLLQQQLQETFMLTRRKKSPLATIAGLGVLTAGWLTPGGAAAQDTAAPPAPPSPPADVGAPPPPPPPPADMMAPPPAPPPAPPADDPTAKALEAHAWGRVGTVISNGADKLNDVSQNAEVNVLLGGQIHKNFGYTANVVGTYPGGPGREMQGTLGILDLIGRIELDPSFNLWVGRMLVPSDRSNFSGPWFQGPWNYPGVFGATYIGPRQGPSGRNDGATIWGDIGGMGKFKYYLGAFDLHNVGASPLFTGRFNLVLIGQEKGFYHSSVYYGSQDILAIGAAFQYQKNGSAQMPMPPAMPGGMPVAGMASNYMGIIGDVLFEKNLGGSGVIGVEALFNLHNGDYEPVKNHFYGTVSYLLPQEIGIGKLQPLIRFQGASPKGGGDMMTVLDAQVGYVVSAYAARLAVGYQMGKFGMTKTNQIFLGLQVQK